MGKKGQICSCRRFPRCILTPHVAEAFVVAVGNSELNYSIIPAHLFVGFFTTLLNISLNKFEFT